MMKNCAATASFLAYLTLIDSKAGAFVVVTDIHKHPLHCHQRLRDKNNNPRENARWTFQSTTGGGELSPRSVNGGGADSSSWSSDEDFVFIAPQALYTEDPNDQRYSASDWFANVKSLPRSTILRAIQGPVISVMAWSFVVSLVHGIFTKFDFTKPWAEAMCISSKPHSFLVSALGLLLVFRTNSAYQRFAEGRKIWENILSISRNISRLSCLYEGDMGAERRQRIFRLLGAFPYLLHHHIQPQCLDPTEYKNLKETKFAMKLRDCADYSDPRDYAMNNDNGNVLSYLAKQFRKGFRRGRRRGGAYYDYNEEEEEEDDGYCGLDEDCDTCMVDLRALPWCLLPPSALSKCADSVNRPLWICDRLSQELTDVPYSDNFTSRERLAFLSQIDKLSKCIGECERITQTAVPLNYARHSLRSLTIWLFSLPFALVGEFGLLTAPVMGVISWLLFGVYQIGSTIEDPFQGSLRLSILCDAVYRDVMYDADLKNKRDSAFELEDELYEWDRLGPIEDSKLLLSASPPTPESSSSAPAGQQQQQQSSTPPTTPPSSLSHLHVEQQDQPLHNTPHPPSANGIHVEPRVNLDQPSHNPDYPSSNGVHDIVEPRVQDQEPRYNSELPSPPRPANDDPMQPRP